MLPALHGVVIIKMTFLGIAGEEDNELLLQWMHFNSTDQNLLNLKLVSFLIDLNKNNHQKEKMLYKYISLAANYDSL